MELSDLSLQLQKKRYNLPSAHKCILRSIRVLESMANIHGPKSQEVISACDKNEFKGVLLGSKSSVVQIYLGQFFSSLSNNMEQRLMTTQSSNVSIEENNEF